MSSQNFSLPIASQGVPPVAGTGNGFGQPSGVAVGPAKGAFGSVGSTHPGNTFTGTVGPRNQVRFQVQPQVTVAVHPVFPLPEGSDDADGARRKDFLFTVNPCPVDARNSEIFTLNTKSNNSGYDAYTDMRRYKRQGVVVCTVQQVNVFLEKIVRNGIDKTSGLPVELSQIELTDLERYMYKMFEERADPQRKKQFPAARNSALMACQVPSIVADVFRPLGVYNSRMTHSNLEEYSSIPQSNVSDIIGVNISNYTFCRDIWGVPLRAGDLLEFVVTTVAPDDTDMYSKFMSIDKKNTTNYNAAYTGSSKITVDPSFVQFVPLAGIEYTNIEELRPRFVMDSNNQPMDTDMSLSFKEIEEDKSILTISAGNDICNGNMNVKYTSEYLKDIFDQDDVVRVPIGRVWVQPLHNAWNNRYETMNIVGWDADRSTLSESDVRLRFNNHLSYNGSQVYHNVEIELLSSHCDVF